METVDTNLERHFATPMIVTAHMSFEEIEYEFQKMTVRAEATREMLAGRLEIEDYLECLSMCGVDPFQVCNDWANGLSYLV